MTNPSKAKGTSWETTLVDYLRPIFGIAERQPLAGAEDTGDVWFLWNGHPYVVEAKATRAINLSEFVNEAQVEAENWWKARKGQYPKPHPLAIIKRRNHSAGKAYVVMTLDDFVRLVKQ